ncbi:hypothetical protein [Nonomuraea jabiensis]|uniref:Uncharacterized protein n=1 Tax=Nonomuraea jabiensis TaxID=882448 RepID=A0A7W9G7T4_9ACTN|nr:hypothetical protein [Nonomuraea jabiensis]MBB5778788.1 hypothetical protein [Nonomuraea jabiensis]
MRSAAAQSRSHDSPHARQQAHAQPFSAARSGAGQWVTIEVHRPVPAYPLGPPVVP